MGTLTLTVQLLELVTGVSSSDFHMTSVMKTLHSSNLFLMLYCRIDNVETHFYLATNVRYIRFGTGQWIIIGDTSKCGIDNAFFIVTQYTCVKTLLSSV